MPRVSRLAMGIPRPRPDQADIKARLESVLRTTGWTMQYLADKMFVSRGLVNRWVRGERKMSARSYRDFLAVERKVRYGGHM